MFHLHISKEKYWLQDNESSELMGQWFLQLSDKIQMELIFI